MALIVGVNAEQAPAPCLLRPEAERPYSKQRLLVVVREQTPMRSEYLIRTCGVQPVWSADFIVASEIQTTQ